MSDDSISRQAAIAALRGWEQCYTWDESCIDAQNVVSPSKVIEGLAPVDSNAEFWENRAAEYSKIIASLVVDMCKGINFESMQITETGKIIFGRGEQNE